MKSTIDYSRITDEAEKHETALLDIRNYLGPFRFEQITKAAIVDITNGGATFDYWEGCCGNLLGIEGYPVRAWWKHINDQLPKATEGSSDATPASRASSVADSAKASSDTLRIWDRDQQRELRAMGEDQ